MGHIVAQQAASTLAYTVPAPQIMASIKKRVGYNLLRHQHEMLEKASKDEQSRIGMQQKPLFSTNVMQGKKCTTLGQGGFTPLSVSDRFRARNSG